MKTVKARIQGNAVVVTIPKNFQVKPGTEFKFEKKKNGALTLIPIHQVPDTLEELFEGWNGSYEMPEDLEDWQNIKPVGEELW